MVICLQQGADLHMAQLMPLPLTVSCFSKTQIGFTFLVPVWCVCVFLEQNKRVYSFHILREILHHVMFLGCFYSKNEKRCTASK